MAKTELIEITRLQCIRRHVFVKMKQAGRLRSWWTTHMARGDNVVSVSILKPGTIYLAGEHCAAVYMQPRSEAWRVHESCHIIQIEHYGRFTFARIYVSDFLKNMWTYRKLKWRDRLETSYSHIRFELQASEVSGWGHFCSETTNC